MSESTDPLPSMRLDGRTALVTGAGRGLGAGIAEALAQAGADVVLLSRSPDELEAVAERIRQRGRDAQVCACDVTDEAAVRNAIAGLPAPHPVGSGFVTRRSPPNRVKGGKSSLG